jgi:hypothetical protein
MAYLHHLSHLCDAKVATAFRLFDAKAQSGPYTTASRSRSLWSLVKAWIDPALANFELRTGLNILDGENFSDVARKNLYGTEEKLRRQIRSYQDQDNWTVAGTLEAILDVIWLCKCKSGRKDQSYNIFSGYDLFGYCELCWRLSAAQQSIVDGKESATHTIGQYKYCKEHDPSGDPTAKANYHADRKHRTAFQKKIRAIIVKRNQEWFYKECTRCDNWYQEIRWVAYQFTHISPNRLLTHGLYRSGHKQVDIAKLLNIKPQTVNEHLNGKKLSLFDEAKDLPKINAKPASLSFENRCLFHLRYECMEFVARDNF